jgi:putative nucleotidyltransferase with HDIG domain
MEQKIKDLLMMTERPGIENLIKAMEEGGFFTAPCSGAYHLCNEGGLAEHSLNVYNSLIQLNDSLEAGLDEKSMILIALLHDLGKMGDHGKPNYVANYVRSKSKNKETGEYDMVISSSKPFETNKELNYEEHEIRSVIIAERYISLTEDEETAILHHNGLYGKLDSSFGSYFDKHQMSFLLHVADMWCSRFVEVKEEE